MPKKLRLQVKAARTLLDWHQKTLAMAAGVTPQTISSLEGGGAVTEATRRVVIAALEKAGIEILDEIKGASGPGARLDWPKWLEKQKEGTKPDEPETIGSPTNPSSVGGGVEGRSPPLFD